MKPLIALIMWLKMTLISKINQVANKTFIMYSLIFNGLWLTYIFTIGRISFIIQWCIWRKPPNTSIFLYIPALSTQCILHILLLLVRYSTNTDLLKHSILRKYFRYAKLIGSREDDNSLEIYSDKVFILFIVEHLIFYPNSRFLIDSWIITYAHLFCDAI